MKLKNMKYKIIYTKEEKYEVYIKTGFWGSWLPMAYISTSTNHFNFERDPHIVYKYSSQEDAMDGLKCFLSKVRYSQSIERTVDEGSCDEFIFTELL